MKRKVSMLVAVAAGVGLAVSGCGGGSTSVPSGAVAVVNGTTISRSQLTTLLELQRKKDNASKQPFPKVGTAEYQALQTQLVAFLVQYTEFQQEAKKLGITVSQKDLDRQVEQDAKTYAGGSTTKLSQELEKQGMTLAEYKKTVVPYTVLAKKIFDKVTKDVKVDMRAYCVQNPSACGATRDVQHILISKKKKNGQVDYKKSKAEADRIYAQLRHGASFAALAKKYSDDPGTKSLGGKYTAQQGRDVPEFDAVAFKLKTGQISPPVATQYGYHVIKALSPIKKANLAGLRSQLLSQSKNTKMAQWVQDLQKQYKKKVSYAAGFEPPQIPTTSTATQ